MNVRMLKMPKRANVLANQKKFENLFTFRNSPVYMDITPPMMSNPVINKEINPRYLNSWSNFISLVI